MAIKIGDKIPSVFLKQCSEGRLRSLETAEIFTGKKVVMFGVPGAFTPVCSTQHLPGYINNLDKFKAMEIEVVCLSVNDPFVMKEWKKLQNAEGIVMLADGNGEFTRALGLEMNVNGFGMGTRCQRFALYAENGIVKYLAIEKPGEFKVSGAESMLAAIRDLCSPNEKTAY